MERAKAFQAKKHAAGFAGIAWPTEWGGRGGTPIQNVIYNQEEAKYDVLSSVFRHRHLAWRSRRSAPGARRNIAPAFAPPALRGEEIWCQLFSEPGGGSDLAAVAHAGGT